MIIGLDIGGTHADAVLIDKDRILKQVKIPTDHSDLFSTVLEGLSKLTEGINTSEISRAVLSTTLTTNAIAEKKTDNAGMIIAAGPGLDPELFRMSKNYFIVEGALDHRGREIKKIDKNQVLAAAKKMKEKGVQHVGIVTKFSTRNPEHEKEIAALIAKDFDAVFMGHNVSGNLNFPRRIATTYLNASVYPVHKAFFEAVIKSLDEKGLKFPIHLLKADGGTMLFEASINQPAQTIQSGPAASVMGALASAPKDKDIIVLDIGGTTTDIAILISGVPVLEPAGIKIGAYKTLIRSLKTKSIGMGGDSFVRVEDGEVKIGPERKGPAMAFGGSSPTPTDALFVLGLASDGDKTAAEKGISEIAEKTDRTLIEAADEIFRSTCRQIIECADEMIDEINSRPVYTIHDFIESYQINPGLIMVMGGPASLFAPMLEEMSGIETVAVPSWGVASALGAGLSRPTCEVTFFADTERGIAIAPEENFSMEVKHNFVKTDAYSKACELLKKKAALHGGLMEDSQIETLEDLSFNMIRGYRSSGKNIRIRVQIKPGLMPGFESIAQS
ncbi:hydantoinase/oxoprolinase family protein [Desulforegula conservatrix]|uniref:hydantoinase/oxoprolinase family protein n=1 Tax=Desulforegula conservatrix TaxID=153026 RepID=UPI0003F99E91|nr:hydantoinase/oxoprolinase family protein [Desulforegula conservatrix]